MMSVYHANNAGAGLLDGDTLLDGDLTGMQMRLSWGPCSCAAEHLTPREADILRLVAEGLSNREIAVRQRISRHTVDRHLVTMLRRSGARNRAELVSMAYLYGIFLLGAARPVLSGRRCLAVHLPAPCLDQDRQCAVAIEEV
jgi:DNA-binding CsgD family transcriptional regulator